MFDHLKDQQHQQIKELNNQEKEKIHDENIAEIVLKVVGIGGAGNNAIQMMDKTNFQHVEFMVANTDAQALAVNDCETQIALGKGNRGLGAGSDPDRGAQLASESAEEIKEKLKGADVVIIAAGLGGGTGTGAAPVFAEIAKSLGALTIAILTTPFMYEGPKRRRYAREGIKNIAKHVDSYIVLSNDKLVENFQDIPVEDTFQLSNLTLKNIILALHDILYRVGKINIDFEDVRKVLSNAGLTMVGIGSATGKDRATKAVDRAFEQDLYDQRIKKASKIIVNIQYDNKTPLKEINTATERVYQLFGASYDDDDEDFEVIVGQEPVEISKDEAEIFRVSVIATGTNDPKVRTLVLDKSNDKEFDEEVNQTKVEEKVEEESLLSNDFHESESPNFIEEVTKEPKKKNIEPIYTYNEYQQQEPESVVDFEEHDSQIVSQEIVDDHCENSKETQKEYVLNYQSLETQKEPEKEYIEEPSDEIPSKYENYESIFSKSNTNEYQSISQTSEGTTKEFNNMFSFSKDKGENTQEVGRKSFWSRITGK